MLEAEKLAADPRIVQAKQLLLEAVRDHQRPINGVRPPDPSLKKQYDELLSVFAQHRGGNLWFPFMGSGIGRGALVELLDGSVKYDFISGIGPHYFGHSYPPLIETGIDAAISDTIMQGNLQQNGDSAALCSALVRLSKMDHCFLTSSGALANENAVKIAMQKRFPAKRLLAFDHCFAGRTLTLSQVTDKPAFRVGLPQSLSVDYIPFYDEMRPEESTREAVQALKKYLDRYPNDYALMLFELVQGEGGVYTGSKSFFTALMQILKEHHVAIFSDEIQSFGRLPQMFATHYYELEEYVDILSIGKLSQVCATLFTEEYRPKAGLLSQTFTGSTSSIRACQLILHELESGCYYGPEGKIQHLYDYFSHKLSDIARRHPHLIQGPFGIGTMVAFTAFGGDYQKVIKYVQELFEAGVMAFIAGSHPTRVRFLIPGGIVTFEDIDNVCQIVEQTLCTSSVR